ncbi:MAG: hypothetical protein ABJA66_00065 [Actinomycetota bacterium]
MFEQLSLLIGMVFGICFSIHCENSLAASASSIASAFDERGNGIFGRHVSNGVKPSDNPKFLFR